MVADVVDVDGLFLAVLDAAHDVADAGLALGQRAQGGGVGQQGAQELDGHDVLALEAHGIDAGHAYIAQHLEVVQVVFREGHPEAGALQALEVLHQGFQFLVVHEEALLGADAVGEVVGHGPGQGIGLHPFAAFPVTAAGGHFADVDLGVEVGGEGLAVVTGVAVDDVQHMHFVQLVLHDPGREDVGDAGVETGAQQGGEAGLLEALLVGPLPFVFELGGIQGLVVGRIQIMHAAFQAGIHDVQVLIGQGDVQHGVGLHLTDEGAELGHVVGIHLGGGDVDAQTGFDRAGDLVTPGKRTAGKSDLAEGPFFGQLGALVRHHASHATGADDQNIRHDFSF